MNNINIFFTVNNYYVPYLATVITSILVNSNKNSTFSFFIISNDILDVNKRKIDKLKSIKNFSIEYLTVSNEDVFKKIPDNHVSSITMDTNYRFMAAELKPNIDKAIFLDADLIVKYDLLELWNIDIEDYYIAAVKDVSTFLSGDLWFKKLPMYPNSEYINSGVLLINMKKWREDKIFYKMIENVNKYYDLLRYPDQDIINITLSEKIKYIDDMGWNFSPTAYYESENIKSLYEKNAKIFHYLYIYKPWKYMEREDLSEYREYFWEYARMTPFYEDIINRQNFEEIRNIKLSFSDLKNNTVQKWNIADFIFSITKTEKYKIITILGIKITIKNK